MIARIRSCLSVALVAILLTCCSNANPLQRFFMMKKSSDDDQSISVQNMNNNNPFWRRMMKPPPEDNDETGDDKKRRGVSSKNKVCISSVAMEGLNEKLATSEKTVEEAHQEREKLIGELARTKSDLVAAKEQSVAKELEWDSIKKTKDEEHMKTVEGLKAETAQYKEELESARKTITELEDAKAKILDEKNEIQALHDEIDEKLSKVKAAQDALEKKRDDLKIQPLDEVRERVVDLEKELSALVGEKQVTEQTYKNLYVKYEALLKDYATTLHDYLEENLEVEVGKQAEIIEQKWQEDFHKLEMQLDQTRMQAEKDLNSALMKQKEEHENERNELILQREDYTGSLSKLIAEKEALKKELADVTDTLNLTKTKLAETSKELEQTKSSLVASEAKAKTLQNELSSKLSELQTTERELKATKDALQAMQEENALTLKAFSKLEATYNETLLDREYWKSVYRRRSLVNLTHVEEEIRNAIEQVKARMSNIMDSQWRAFEKITTPFVHKGKELYNQNIKGHIDTIIKRVGPVFDKHVAPVLEMCRKSLLDARMETENLMKWAFKEMVSIVDELCRQSLKKIPSDNDIVRTALLRICHDSEQVVVRVLIALAVILLILFRQPLWNALSATLLAVVRVVWYLSPLRLLINLFTAKPAAPASDGAVGKPDQSVPFNNESNGNQHANKTDETNESDVGSGTKKKKKNDAKGNR